MKELIVNARPYAKKLLVAFSALFAVGFVWLGLTLVRAQSEGADVNYVGPILFFTTVFFAVVVWIIFAIGQDNRKVPKHRRPTWEPKQPTRGAEI